MKAERTEAKKAPMGNETGKTRMNGIYVLVQCTWGALQTLLGLAVFALHVKERHFRYHGAVVTRWKCRSSVSLGLFVFVTDRPYFAEKFKGEIPVSELAARLVVHEYGHTLQSLMLGPLYLPVIGISSTVWGFFRGLPAGGGRGESPTSLFLRNGGRTGWESWRRRNAPWGSL